MPIHVVQGKGWHLFEALQVPAKIALGMYHSMLKAHAAKGETAQAVALIKEMRALELPLRPSACSLLIQAFCKANALQVIVIVNVACNIRSS